MRNGKASKARQEPESHTPTLLNGGSVNVNIIHHCWLTGNRLDGQRLLSDHLWSTTEASQYILM